MPLENTQMLYSSAYTGTHYIIKEVNVVQIIHSMTSQTLILQGIKVEDISARPYQEKLTFLDKISKQEMILYRISKAHSSEKQKKLMP